MNDLNLALIGNCNIGALVNAQADIVWGCFPRLDGDATFCSLLQGERGEDTPGIWSVELFDLERSEQEYLPHTPVLVTRLYDKNGGIVEITDFSPRFTHHNRIYCPMILVRRLKRIAGCPRVQVRLRPATDYGAGAAAATPGSNHIRYFTSQTTLRLTTDASITAIMQETPFLLNDHVNLLLGPDETVTAGVHDVCSRYEQQTIDYWRDWVRSLAIPFEWQEVVIRAAIILKQNAFEDTGAIIAAMTTSIPEANDDSGRNWDYRFCWLRDAYFTLNALNSL
ncbi:MAG: glycoside hydrolase family 15 protein, partial [Pseudomonadota bacterium]